MSTPCSAWCRSPSVLGGIPCRVRNACRLKASVAQSAGIAATAGGSVGCRIVTTVSQSVIDTQRGSQTDDVRLRQMNQRRMNVETALVLDAGLGCQVRQLLERRHERGTAIGITRVILAVDSDANIEAAQH